MLNNSILPYSGKVWWGGKFGEFGKSSVIRQTKTIQISMYNAKQKHLGCKKRRGQSEAAII